MVNIEAMIHVIVDQRAFGVHHCFLDRLQLLRDLEAGLARLDHRDHCSQVPVGAFQRGDQGGMGCVNMGPCHRRTLSSLGDRTRWHHARAADLAEFLTDLARELSKTGLKIAFDAECPVLAIIRRTPMRRVLRNLLESAQRCGSGAQVTLRVTGPDVEILIDDEGPGIPTQDLDRVFDPFTRLETSRPRETGGIGLGLPIAWSIVRAHGGDVILMPRQEGGLRAQITLPQHPAVVV
jgi:signal transduction histidine kinase